MYTLYLRQRRASTSFIISVLLIKCKFTFRNFLNFYQNFICIVVEIWSSLLRLQDVSDHATLQNPVIIIQLLGVLEALASAKNTSWVSQVSPTPLLESIFGQQWDPTTPIVVHQSDIRLHYSKNDRRLLLEETVVQIWIGLTFVQEWPKRQQWLSITLV